MTDQKGKGGGDADGTDGGPFDDAAVDGDPARVGRVRTSVDQANDVLFPESVPAVKFESIGDSVEGVVIDMAASQQTDINTNEPLYWDDGKPRMQVVVTLLTGIRDPDLDDDDGRRRLFVRADMARAVRDAVKEAGKQKVAVGATLCVRYAADGTPPRRGLTAPKKYQAIYAVPEAAL